MTANKKKKRSSDCPYIDYYKKTNATQRQMLSESDFSPMLFMSPSMDPGYSLGESMASMDCMDPCPIPLMPEEIVYARAYVPFQCYTEAFSPQEALMKGTLFPELYQPQWFIKPIPR